MQASFPDCSTYAQFGSMFSLHLRLFTSGAPQFQNLTGCLPPCQYAEFDLAQRSFENPHITAVFGNRTVSALAISLRSTNEKVRKSQLKCRNVKL